MRQANGHQSESGVREAFERAVAVPPRKDKKKKPPPYSIRFSEDERARLNRDAGTLSWAAYIRLRLFCDENSPPPRKKLTRKVHSPSAELAVLGQLLGTLGKTELAATMADIASAAKIGALPVTPELEQELLEACAAIRHMRRELIVALSIKPKGGQ